MKTQQEDNIYKPRTEIKTTLPSLDIDSISDLEISECKPHGLWVLVMAALANKHKLKPKAVPADLISHLGSTSPSPWTFGRG